MDYFNLIDAYLNGELTGSELTNFLNEVRQNSDLAAELELHKKLNKFLQDKAVEIKMREDLNKIHKEYMRSHSIEENKLHNVSSKKKNKKLYYYLTAAAIIILVCLYILLKSDTNSNKKIFITYFKPYDISETTRGENVVDSSLIINQASSEYETAHYSDAVRLFLKVVQKDSDNYKALFLLGISYIEIDSITDAIKSFQRIVKSDSINYDADAHWYLGLCYLKKDDRQKAIEQFHLLKGYSQYYVKKADEILVKLEK